MSPCSLFELQSILATSYLCTYVLPQRDKHCNGVAVRTSEKRFTKLQGCVDITSQFVLAA